MESFQPFLGRLVTAVAGRLAQRHFPGCLVDDYPRQFAALSEELAFDHKVDASVLRGLDLNRLGDGIAGLIEDRLDRAREGFSGPEFERLVKLLYLQTGDEVWREHMAHTQSLVLSAQLCGHGGGGGLAAYTLSCFESYADLQDRTADSFLPRLTAFTGGPTGEAAPRTVELSEEVLQLLA